MLAEHFFSTGDSVAGDTLMLMNRTAPKMSDIRDVRLRVSLDPDLPITTDDVQGTTIYVHPYNGNTIVLYSDGEWAQRSLEEVLLVNETLAADTVYDLFLYWDGEEIQGELTPWASASARTFALELLDGVYVKELDNTRRYIWSGATDASGDFNDAQTNRASWNLYNKVGYSIAKTHSGVWTVSTSYGPIAGNAAINVQILNGLTGAVLLLAGVAGHQAGSINGSSKLEGGIGVNATGSDSGLLSLPQGFGLSIPAGATWKMWMSAFSMLSETRLGYHKYYPLEKATGSPITGSAGGILGLVFA